jgi:Ca-activated chloride channel family protein
MFRFEEPAYLWLLLLIPALCALRILLMRQQKKRWRKFADPTLIKQLAPDVSLVRRILKFILLMVALALLIVMLARPQMGAKISKEKRQGIETIIALDISNSMLAQDVEPSRLEKSKMLVENLVDHFYNDKIGLIVFAGDAFVQLPITSDYISAKMFLQNAEPSLIQQQGTDIGEAIRLAMHSFSQNDKTGKAIVVITDGEDHEGDAEAMAKEAEKNGIHVFILGVGSKQGAPIPIGEGDYLKDNSGQVVMSALNEDMCKRVAEAGKGTYIYVDNSSSAEAKLDAEISKLQKGEINKVLYSEYDEQFQAVGILVLLILIIEVLILECNNPVTKGWRIFNRGK